MNRSEIFECAIMAVVGCPALEGKEMVEVLATLFEERSLALHVEENKAH